MYKNDPAAAIASILERAERRQKANLAAQGADFLSEVFAKARRESFENFFGGEGAERERDEIRSAAARNRANELELKRMLDGLSAEEEAERSDLESRRTPGGHYLSAKTGS